MLIEQLKELNYDIPVLCADGKLGLLVLFPTTDNLCGIQVHGEEEHRWIQLEDLDSSLMGAARQKGGPTMPPATAQEDIVQFLLALEWAKLGGPLIPINALDTQESI